MKQETKDIKIIHMQTQGIPTAKEINDIKKVIAEYNNKKKEK